MSRFGIDKQGYNVEEVDQYISMLSRRYEAKLSEQKDRIYGLKNELESTRTTLEGYQNKEKQISKALVLAVEKAEEVEQKTISASKKRLNELKNLYDKWNELLSKVETKYVAESQNQYLRTLVKELKEKIDSALSTEVPNTTTVRNELKNYSSDYIKNILNRMDYVVNKSEKQSVHDDKGIVTPSMAKLAPQNVKPAPKQYSIQPVIKPVVNMPKVMSTELNKLDNEPTLNKDNSILQENVDSKPKEIDMSEVMSEHQKENNRIITIGGRLQSLFKKVDNVKSNIADSYLNSEVEDDKNGYTKAFIREKPKTGESPFNYAFPEPNESGFDLKEALNPKEDLDEIMKSFDFYNKQ